MSSCNRRCRATEAVPGVCSTLRSGVQVAESEADVSPTGRRNGIDERKAGKSNPMTQKIKLSSPNLALLHVR